MEPNKNETEQGKTLDGNPNKPSTTPVPSTAGASSHAASAPQRARENASDAGGGVQTAYDQTVKAVGEAYDKTSKVLGDTYNKTSDVIGNTYDKTSEVIGNTYDQTMAYGKENPGKLTLIAFGAGIGLGVLLASGLGGGRRSNTRFAEPIVTALSQVALELFR